MYCVHSPVSSSMHDNAVIKKHWLNIIFVISAYVGDKIWLKKFKD